MRFKTRFFPCCTRSCRGRRWLRVVRCRRSGFLGTELQAFRLLCRFTKASRVRSGIQFTCSQFGFIFILFLTMIIEKISTSMSYYSTSCLKCYWDIYWTGGAKCKGTSLIVATKGFLTKSILF